MRANKFFTICLIALLLIAPGCFQWSQKYGKTLNLTGKPGEITIQILVDNWTDYRIYYAGLDIRSPLGVMFDPKNNDTVLTGDRWKPITDQKALKEAVKWLGTTTESYRPDLKALMGPNDRLFGYMYHSHGHIILRVIDDKTLYVNDLSGSIREDELRVR